MAVLLSLVENVKSSVLRSDLLSEFFCCGGVGGRDADNLSR
jgi:hypothetical protein